MQTTDTVLMVRPVNFGYNPQTADNNLFQKEGHSENAQQRALEEFDSFTKLLQENGVRVIIVEDTLHPPTPDSIFPNNWFSTHSEGNLVLYPMFAPNRRDERDDKIVELIKRETASTAVVDLTDYEKRDLFLEGTGSMILDRENRIAYVCHSVRSNEEVLGDFCSKLDYTYIYFDASDKRGEKIYHTNVMMSIGTDVAIICLDAVDNISDRELIIESLEESGKEVFEISLDQMDSFAGNMLELHNREGEKILVMSLSAYNSLDSFQRERLNSFYRLLTPDLNTIEMNGGGSARCMMAEIFK